MYERVEGLVWNIEEIYVMNKKQSKGGKGRRRMV
jgi:hypothetical protein